MLRMDPARKEEIPLNEEVLKEVGGCGERGHGSGSPYLILSLTDINMLMICVRRMKRQRRRQRRSRNK